MEKSVVVFEEVARLADADLLVGLKRWVRADRSITARLLVHLGEVDARGLYRDRAWPSMFAYATGELHMSESEAYVRITAARLGRQFPRIVELLAQGALHLTAIKLLGPHLTFDNHVQVLERARGKSKLEIEELIAELAPKPDAPSRIRKLPAPVSTRAVCTPVAHQGELNTALTPMFANVALSAKTQSSAPMLADCPVETASSAPTCTVAAQPAVSATTSPARDDHGQFQLEPAPRNVSSTTPLRPGRYKVEFTTGEGMHCKLEQLRALLRHQVPDGNLAVILERAADLLLEKTRKERFALTRSPRVSKTRTSEARSNESGAREAKASAASTRAQGVNAPDANARAPGTNAPDADARAPGANARDANPRAQGVNARDANATRRGRPGHAHSRYIPRSVVRAMHARDGEQCTFVSPDGRRCPERGFLQHHHHDTPYARGGAATTDNIRTVCRAHNALFAERDFGRAFIHSKLFHARSRKLDGAKQLVLQREPE